MKKILLIIICAITFFNGIVKGQESQKFVYEKILSYDSVSKDDLYKYSKRWVTNLFPNSNAVLRTDDLASGEIIGMGYTEIIENPNALYSPNMTIEFTFMISLKNNKARIRIYDLTQVTPMGFRSTVVSIDNDKQSSKAKTKLKWDKFSSLINSEFNGLIDNYASKMNNDVKDEF